MYHIVVLAALLLGPLMPGKQVTAQALGAPSLLQFTAGGHALGFISQGMYAASGSHAWVGNPLAKLSYPGGEPSAVGHYLLRAVTGRATEKYFD